MKINKTQIARHLRQEQTPAEKKLWGIFRNRQFENLKFRRQHPLKGYIVDFYCDELELIIELDGGHHNSPEQKFKDEQRDYHLSFLGYKVLRYQNTIVFNDVQSIFLDITNVKSQAPSQRERAGVREKHILSTKILTSAQKASLKDAGLNVAEYDAIEIVNIEFEVPKNIENAIFTSQNAVKSIQNSKFKIQNLYCVGEKTKALLEENDQKVIKTAKNASELTSFILKKHKNKLFHFFCGNLRGDELPSTLKKAKIDLFEVKVYETKLNLKHFDQKWDGILFFSPSGVQSFTSENQIRNSRVICIGETTASEAKKHTNNINIASETTIESVIEKAIEILKTKTVCSSAVEN